ncbi:MAG TPA: TRAP transporter substrate-binding protein [Ideonella sp.]|uniref:TRAP transporter substrate-binding protein n=1 Tax=Ideonella sp. TaxID=1929293 RepID=UPI002E3234CE|nr:TRAP transporter substrate-binding protein [Ideonella sp.]HEX5686957.1 TRAP transporter substrate-binding protein [Ideonella sp.]
MATATAAETASAPAAAAPLRIVGGLANVNQYTRHEEPFWTQELPRLTNGKLRATIVPFDRAGIRGQDMLRLMQLGVVPFGTALVSLSSATEPLLGAADLAGLNPDMASLRRHVMAYRPFLEKTLRERHGVELLAIYVYPAQMLFCQRPLKGLADLAGRRVRTASATQADWVEALGAHPVNTAFAELTQNLRSGNVECALTGSMSGYTIGLQQHTRHLFTMPVSWGMAVFGANTGAWAALPADQRSTLKQELMRLEQVIWADSERETGDGVRCLTGEHACGGQPGRLQARAPTPADDQRRRNVLAGTVIARWIQRCGSPCAEAWNQTIGPISGVEARSGASPQ